MPDDGTRTPGHANPATLDGFVAGRHNVVGAYQRQIVGVFEIPALNTSFDVVGNSYGGAEQHHRTS